MTLLVFGKSGQVATELSRQRTGVYLDREAADLSNPAACIAAIREHTPDVVINAAAYTNVDRAETDETLAHKINAEAPGAMAKVCADLAIPLLHVSTDYVFSGQGKEPWTPDAPCAPVNAYGRSKLAGERAIRSAAGQHVILRTSWVFAGHGSNFVRSMLKLGRSKTHLSVVDDQVGGPTPAGDIAKALLRIADNLKQGQKGGTYHFAGAPTVSWKDFAEAILARADLDVTLTGIPTAAYPTPAVRPLNSRLDCTTLTTDFGIEPPDWQASLSGVIKELGR